MTTQISSRDWEALSAYLDGQLPPKELQNLEARLETRADLRAALEELRRTRTVLRARLSMRAPRNFTLTPEMAGLRARSRPFAGLFPAMRLASVLSSFLFVLVVMGELLLGTRLPMQPSIALEQAREAAPAATEAPPQELPAAALKSAPEPEEAQPTPAEIAKALDAASATLEAPAPSFEEMLITETSQAPGGGVGVGGGAGEDEVQNQQALSAMAPAPTATPLPTPTATPTATPEPTPAPTESPVAPPPSQIAWRWLEVALAIVGITTGLVAFYLYRTGRT
jgi:hypothetical protein